MPSRCRAHEVDHAEVCQTQSAHPTVDLIELKHNWRLVSADASPGDGAEISNVGYDDSAWHSIAEMPRTVLAVLQENDVCEDLYSGDNIDVNANPKLSDLSSTDWWYRTEFAAPAGSDEYWLIVKGINYRAQVFVNGQEVAGNDVIVGTFCKFELNITDYVNSGGSNALAFRITPQHYHDSTEVGFYWVDWINFTPPDYQTGIWNPVCLKTTGKVAIEHPHVVTDLPLPALDSVDLTVEAVLKNGSDESVTGTLEGTISREGKRDITFSQDVTLSPNETRKVYFRPEDYAQFHAVPNPDIWWPYMWGEPALYDLDLTFRTNRDLSDAQSIRFGVRKITDHRDANGYFYLRVNGRDFRMLGGNYTPDFLMRYDREQDEATVRYIKDLGLNIIRWEGKMGNEYLFDRFDEEGILAMIGWVCCGPWEKWDEWNEETHRVARDSTQAQVLTARHHACMAIWGHASDGLPPDDVLNDYKHILFDELNWQNTDVDTVAYENKRTDGIHMRGPYSWQAPVFWFGDHRRDKVTEGTCVEQGDNEHIVPYESLRKFIPADKLYPMDDHYWPLHSGRHVPDNANTRTVIDRRYGGANCIEEFTCKAQMIHYESTKAHFEAFCARSWERQKGTIYWMLNSHYPGFFGHIWDYYQKPGGAYFGAKKALRPVNVVYDYYGSGDRTTAKIYVVNRTLTARTGLDVSVRVYNLDGSERFSKTVSDFDIGANQSVEAFTFGRISGLTDVFLVRAQLSDTAGRVVADNWSWQSIIDEVVGSDYGLFQTDYSHWGDLSDLDNLAPALLSVSTSAQTSEGRETVRITIENTSNCVAFFLRASVTKGADGDEVLPVVYDDNYLILLPGETRQIEAEYSTVDLDGKRPYLKVEGHNMDAVSVPVARIN